MSALIQHWLSFSKSLAYPLNDKNDCTNSWSILKHFTIRNHPKVRTPYYTQTNNNCIEFICTLNQTSSYQCGMYQCKVDLDMFNGIKIKLADVSSVSPSSDQRNSGEGL